MNPSLKETLDIWDMQMLQYGTKIINTVSYTHLISSGSSGSQAA